MDVSLVATKWDGSLNCRMTATTLGEDADGSWLGTTAGWLMERATRTLTIPYSCVFYVPRDRGYLARFSDPSSDARAVLYVDITTVPQWGPCSVEMIDLDLDVVRDQQGAVEAVDEDEFDANAARFCYPEDVVAGARAELDVVMGMIRSSDGPFGDQSTTFLRMVAT